MSFVRCEIGSASSTCVRATMKKSTECCQRCTAVSKNARAVLLPYHCSQQRSCYGRACATRLSRVTVNTLAGLQLGHGRLAPTRRGAISSRARACFPHASSCGRGPLSKPAVSDAGTGELGGRSVDASKCLTIIGCLRRRFVGWGGEQLHFEPIHSGFLVEDAACLMWDIVIVSASCGRLAKRCVCEQRQYIRYGDWG